MLALALILALALASPNALLGSKNESETSCFLNFPNPK